MSKCFIIQHNQLVSKKSVFYGTLAAWGAYLVRYLGMGYTGAMVSDRGTFLSRVKVGLKNSIFGRLFWDRKFFNYTWIGILISLLNIFLLWLFIDVFNIPTVISSVIVIGATFIIRYLLYIFAKML